MNLGGPKTPFLFGIFIFDEEYIPPAGIQHKLCIDDLKQYRLPGNNADCSLL